MADNRSSQSTPIVHGDGNIILTEVQAENITIYHYTQQNPTAFSPIVRPPRLPDRHFERPRLVQEINDRLEKLAKSLRRPVCIILGPTGHGKTTIAVEWCRERRVLWLDASKVGDLETSDIPENSDIVIDLLDDAPQNLLENRPWLAHLEGRIVAITSQKKVVDQLKMIWRVADHDVTVEVNQGFTNRECLEFIRCSIPANVCNEFDQQMITDLNQTICGSPLFWQFVSGLVCEDDFPRLAEGLRNPNSLETRDKTYFRLFAKWAKLESDQSEAFNVAYLLSCISLLGMNDSAMAYVLNTDLEKVKIGLDVLQRKGFVRRIGEFDDYWLPHDLLRNMCQVIVNERALITKRERYAQFFYQKLAAPNLERRDLHTLIDAWLLCVGNHFNEAWYTYADGHREPFYSAYEKMNSHRERIMECFKHQNVEEAAIARFIAEGASKLQCYNIIPASRLLAKSKSPNVDIARLLKVVFKAEDSWARAEAIHAASIHWSKQTPEIALEGREVLFTELRNYEEKTGAGISEDAYNQLPVAACLSGLCLLGEPEKAIEISRRSHIRNRFPNAEIVVFLYLLTGRQHEVIVPFFQEMKPEGSWVDNVLPFVQRYVTNLGYPFPFEKKARFTFNPNLPIILANLSDNEEFARFVESYCQQAKQLKETLFELQDF